jgi:dienelactone hydrolase
MAGGLAGCGGGGGGSAGGGAPALPSLIPSAHAETGATFSQFNWIWPHPAETLDMPPEALADAAALGAWRASFAATLRARADAVPMSAPSPAVLGAPEVRVGYSLQRIDHPFPGGPTIQTLLAVPHTVDPGKPIIVAIHGHEVSPWGTAPYALFDNDWAEKWAQAGYVVWAPSHLWYQALSPFYPAHDYYTVWVRMLERLFDATRMHLPAHSGYIATGHSAGGTSATMLMALRPEFRAGVFGGSFVPLDYLRENYRLSNHPNNWDVRGILSYMPIYALAAPRPVQWQLGKQDPFYPRGTRQPASGCCYPGTPRPVDVTQTFGELFVAQRIWGMLGGPAPELQLHEGGHVYDFTRALSFVGRL